MLSLLNIKSHFPVFSHHPELIYFDNAASSQRPKEVIEAISRFYEQENANIHRGVYPLSSKATQAYEKVRQQVADFIGASSSRDIAFTTGTTDAINRVASGYLQTKLQEGDNILISALEHHANLIPWQILAQEKKAELRVLPVDKAGNIDLNDLVQMLDARTRLLAITAISNSIGTINPIAEITDLAHRKGVPVLIDGAQSTGLYPLNVKIMGADFYTFSAHKMFGPFGVGVLYVRPRYQDQIKPTNFGGGMIKRVQFTQSEFLDFPQNQEAGTPNVAGVIGLGAAISFCEKLDQQQCAKHLKSLAGYAREAFGQIEGLQLVGQPKDYGGIVSFVMDAVHPHDLAQFLGAEGIAVRAGHHCTQPLLESMGLAATTRASFSIYNTIAEIDQMVEVLNGIKKFWT